MRFAQAILPILIASCAGSPCPTGYAQTTYGPDIYGNYGGSHLTVCEQKTPDGRVIGTQFSNGVANGFHLERDSDGRTLAAGRFQHGVKDGTWMLFDPSEETATRIEYELGVETFRQQSSGTRPLHEGIQRGLHDP